MNKLFIGSLLLMSVAFFFIGCQNKSVEVDILVGTYGQEIYRYAFDEKTLEFKLKESVEAHNASYAISDDGNIYAVSETGAESGAYSFRMDGVTVMTADKRQTGDDPCFIMEHDGKVFTADYSGGSITVFPVSGGVLGESCQKIESRGRGPVSGRQDAPHFHQVRMLPRSTWLLASDPGADVIRVLHNEDGLLTHISDIACPSGSGPRHMEFSKDGKMLYCIAELSGEVLAYSVAAVDGCPQFTLIQRILADEVNAGGSADIHIHPSGKYLYTSHRLDNDGISVFEIQPDGTLVKVSYARTGRHPRNFMITPEGSHLLVACMNDRLVQVFKINQDGTLSITPSVLTFEEDRPSSLLAY